MARYRDVSTTLFGSIRSLGVAAGTFAFARLMPLGTGLTFWITAAVVLVVVAIVLFLFDEQEIPVRKENVD